MDKRPEDHPPGPTVPQHDQPGQDAAPCVGLLPASLLPEVVETFSDGVAIARIADSSSPLLYVNAAFERMTGYARHEVLGKDCRYLQGSDRDQPEVSRIRAAIAAGKKVEVTLRNYRKDGTAFWNRLHLRPLAGADDRLYLGILRDVSAIRQAEVALERAANRDVATGCLNRQSFILALDRPPGAPDGLRLMMKLDIVGFHDINAEFGFDAGDALLSETVRRLQEAGAETVGRMGANEFALLCDLTDEAAAEDMVSRISATLARDFVVPGASLALRFAIGYAVDRAGGSPVALLRNSGTALKGAKSDLLGGPSRFRHADAGEASRRIRLTRELKAAVANGEFVHHFQPQIDLATGERIGAEALIRWNHPVFGSQPPGLFIEAAERSGLILDLGERSLADVATFARRINAGRERPLRFSVNVSATEFRHRDMAEVVDRVVRQTGAEPTWLTLEITESVLLSETPGVVDACRRLRDRGVGLSIDDFGTGYSSLRLLETIPVTEIKIDRSFVGDLATSAAKMAIVRAIIDLGRALGVTVVAEGVETESQRTFLAGMGCPVGQGYLFARPVDAGSFEASVDSVSQIV